MKLIITTILFFILSLNFLVTQKVYASNHTLSDSQLNELISDLSLDLQNHQI